MALIFSLQQPFPRQPAYSPTRYPYQKTASVLVRHRAVPRPAASPQLADSYAQQRPAPPMWQQRVTGLGLNLVVNPGLRFNRFGLGADLQYNPFFATHIKHTDEYRQND